MPAADDRWLLQEVVTNKERKISLEEQWLLVRLRMAADAKGESKSLVAIAAQFERDIESYDVPQYIKQTVSEHAHCRNVKKKWG